MIIYLITFFISCLFLKLSNKCKKDKLFHFILVSMALLLPCLLAGMRAYTIGTDIQVYVKPLYNCALRAEKFSNYLDMSVMTTRIVKDFELGFTSMIYIITKLTKSLQINLFVIQFLIILPLYLGLKKSKNLENKLWISMLVFYFMFFNTSLNLMRQYIGISFVFYGTCCLLTEKKGTLKFFIFLVLATLFHTSSILGIFIYLIYRILKSQSNRFLRINSYLIPMNKFFMLTIIFSLIIFITNSNVFVHLMQNFGFYRYAQYINGNVRFFSSTIIRNVPIILLLFITSKNFIKKYNNTYLYIILFVMSVVIAQLGTANIRGGRIAYLFSFFNVISLPLMIESPEKKDMKHLLTIALIIYLIAYWYYSFVYLGGNETIPYIFYQSLN